MDHDKHFLHSFYSARYLLLIAMLFMTLLLAGTAVAYKIVHIGWFTLPASSVIFPITYALGDVITEVYGFAVMRQLIWFSAICGFVFIFIIVLALHLPPAPYWHSQAAFDAVFKNSWLFTAAATVGMALGAFLNSYAIAKWKVLLNGRYFWLRSLGATFSGSLVHVLIVGLIAFLPFMPLAHVVVLIISMYCYRLLYGMFAVGPAFALAKFLKRAENLDIYDQNTNFNPFKLAA
jgi:uncharacterized integral membrane protein (TIGR00697 family)